MHTNTTPNYNLPQFVSTDKPTWLGDVNGAMSAIDTAIAGVNSTATGADSKADNATTTANTAATTAGNAATLAETANTNANSALTTAGNAATAANAAQSAASAVDTKVGALTDLTTTDKTSVIAAINEVKSEDGTITLNMGDLTNLTTTIKTDLVSAINEVNAGGGGGTAADITYDNTTSGLTADNVQEAIDELKTLIVTPTAVTQIFNGTDGLNADCVITEDLAVSGSSPNQMLVIGTNKRGGAIIGADFTNYNTLTFDLLTAGQYLAYQIGSISGQATAALGNRRTVAIDVSSLTGALNINLNMSEVGAANSANIYGVYLS